jgi:hypothetical protein
LQIQSRQKADQAHNAGKAVGAGYRLAPMAPAARFGGSGSSASLKRGTPDLSAEEWVMLRRFGPLALSLGSLLGPAALAQAPAQAPPAPYASMPSAPAVEHASDRTGPVTPRSLIRDPENFNPYDVYYTMRAEHLKNGADHEKPSLRYIDHEEGAAPGVVAGADAGPGGCTTCGGRHLGLPGLQGIRGRFSNMCADARSALSCEGWKDGVDCPDPQFQCANCYGWTNFEKKMFIQYHYLYPLRTASKVAYGESNGAMIGVEWLPWVIRDDERHFTRWGVITAFDYQNFNGNRTAIIQSLQSGNILSSSSGNAFGAIIAPVWRHDFFIFNHRFSPSMALGLSLDWVAMRETDPNSQTPAPIAPGIPTVPEPFPNTGLPFTNTVLQVDSFRYTDFCVGGYGKFMIDIPLHDKLNLGFGMDLRLVPSKVFLPNDGMRKHFGVIVQLSADF